MKKKSLLIIALAVLSAGMVFAQEGGYETPAASGKKGTYSAGAGGLFATGNSLAFEMDLGPLGKMDIDTPYIRFGGFGFFDATYAEASVGFALSSGKNSFSATNLLIGLLGKYPFALGKEVSLFPLAGIQYDLCLSAKGSSDAGDLSALWIKFGAGADYALSQTMYLRVEALYGLRLPNKAEGNASSTVKSTGGFTANVAVGFNL